MALLQMGLPGGPELVILLLVLVVYLALPVLLIVVVYNFLDGKRGYQKRIAELERRVEELEDDRFEP
ncbi:hypothetical protein [Haloarcula laminariae]|uniref:hypothetical protein n=1 Tax=Haloarcula laminariae TaxID=2961577 RepID=UPI0021C8CE41|nr:MULTISPECIES: hypothetical protein [Halomicroarcula]